MAQPCDYDVIIIGAGLFGAATGFHLARQGQSVLMLERDHIGAQSSGANYGSLRLQGRIDTQYPLSLRAQHLWETFEATFGEPCEYERTGHVYFARDDAGRAKVEAYAEASRSVGMQIEMLEGAALRQRLPFLTENATVASFSPKCATANPRLATPAICRAFERAGGHLRTQCAVIELWKEGQLFHVRTSSGLHLTASKLVNAAGAWAGSIAAQFGEAVPLFAAGPPQFVTEPLPYILRPVLQSIEGDVILRQIPRGNFIFAGYPRTRANPDGAFTFVPSRKLAKCMRALVEAVPALSGVEVIRNWSGVEGYLPDMLPIVGASQTTDNLFHAFGASGGGFQIGLAVGESLAAQVAGASPICDLSTYRIDRFAAGLVESDKIAKEFDN
ncbi:NAD(P)/FAD-dependent oxidoreductase [Roseovarius sp. D0-M9]|uniref:NAD(P)/FAD-dependent oxidoreductase n=1 Tax=Roseovarius sp. D0-M9 TaxID=3127117 RepID=UPI0030103E26